MSNVTVICCYNDEKQYTDFVNTLKIQNCPYELIGIDNRGNGAFTSCAAAYNSVINDVKTEYVIYSHQDILLEDSECLQKFVSCLKRIGSNDILGVIGVRFDTPGAFADYKHLIKQIGKLYPAGKHHLTSEIMEVDTVDECFFGGHTEHFREYPFDEVTCDNWHLYAAEACLRIKSNDVQGGGMYLSAA